MQKVKYFNSLKEFDEWAFGDKNNIVIQHLCNFEGTLVVVYRKEEIPYY